MLPNSSLSAVPLLYPSRGLDSQEEVSQLTRLLVNAKGKSPGEGKQKAGNEDRKE